MKKRTGLNQISLPDASEPKPSKKKKREGENPAASGEKVMVSNYRKLTLYLPERAYKQLRIIAAEEGVKSHDLLVEWVDAGFRTRGRKTIGELKD